MTQYYNTIIFYDIYIIYFYEWLSLNVPESDELKATEVPQLPYLCTAH